MGVKRFIAAGLFVLLATLGCDRAVRPDPCAQVEEDWREAGYQFEFELSEGQCVVVVIVPESP